MYTAHIRSTHTHARTTQNHIAFKTRRGNATCTGTRVRAYTRRETGRGPGHKLATQSVDPTRGQGEHRLCAMHRHRLPRGERAGEAAVGCAGLRQADAHLRPGRRGAPVVPHAPRGHRRRIGIHVVLLPAFEFVFKPRAGSQRAHRPRSQHAVRIWYDLCGGRPPVPAPDDADAVFKQCVAGRDGRVTAIPQEGGRQCHPHSHCHDVTTRGLVVNQMAWQALAALLILCVSTRVAADGFVTIPATELDEALARGAWRLQSSFVPGDSHLHTSASVVGLHRDRDTPLKSIHAYGGREEAALVETARRVAELGHFHPSLSEAVEAAAAAVPQRRILHTYPYLHFLVKDLLERRMGVRAASWPKAALYRSGYVPPCLPALPRGG